MKKLMVAIAAVATTFGLYATDTGTSFEGVEVTDTPLALEDEIDNIDEMTAGSYWGATIPAGTTINKYNDDKYTGARPSPFGEEPYTAQFNYLKLSSGAAELTRYAVAKDGSRAVPFDVKNSTNKDKSYFFDSLVKLTAFDSKPVATGAKIALWLKDGAEWDVETEQTATTNLMVTVGSTDYDCGDAASLVDAWKRVTIKAMMVNDSDMGFVIFINGNTTPIAFSGTKIDMTGLSATAKVYAENNQLFLAAQGDTEITSVGFQGQGSVDDLVFTETIPTFANNPAAYEIKWDSSVMTDITTNGAPVVGTSPVVVLGAKPDSMTIGWTGVGNYASSKGQSVSNFDLTTITPAAAEATFNEVNWTLADAVDEANKANGTLQILAENVGAIALTGDFATTIDLNGKTVSQGAGLAAISAMGVASSIVITGEGTVAGYGSENPVAVVAANACTIQGGTFDGSVGVNGTFTITDCACKFSLVNDKATLDAAAALTGKEFVEENGYWVLKEIPKYTLSVAASIPNGSVTINPVAGNYPAGKAVTVATTPAEGYSLDTITTNGQALAGAAFDMPADAVEVSAVFTGNVYAVTFDVDGGSDAVLPMEYTYNGAAIKAPAYAGTKEGFEFAGCWTNVTDGGAAYAVGADLPVNVIGGYTLTAVWNKNQGWPVNPDDVKGQDAKETFPNLPAEFEGADAGLVAAWAKDPAKGNLAYDDMAEADIDAFLLDCAEDDVETEMAKFKIVSITADGKGDWIVKVVDETTGEGSVYRNGKIQLLGKTAIDAEGEWHEKIDTDTVFKAKLAPYRVGVE